MKKLISHTKHKVMITCKRLTALVLALLLFIMTIPSAIDLGNESPILPDQDIPETLTRAQLEAHGAVARLRAEEPDESDAQIYEEEPPTNHQMYFDKSSEIKWWLATAEGAERYKSFEYINHDYIVDPYQVEKGMIDHLINKVREDGMPVPYINGKDASYNWWIQIPGTRSDASVYYKVDINNHMYLIQMTHIDKEYLQYAQEGYDAYQTVMGEFHGYTPTAFTIGQTEYNGAFNKDDSYDTIYFYAIIDGWDVRIRGNQGVTQEEILNDLTQLEFNTGAVPSVILIIIIIIAAAIAVATAVILLKRKKKKVPTE